MLKRFTGRLNSFRTHPLHGLHALILICLVISIAGTQSARAQGTMGTLPDPITSAEFSGYADRLGLSPAQRRAVNRHYEQYHAEFRELRDGEIADFLKSLQEMDGGRMNMPSRAQFERFLRDWDRTKAKIEALDNQFFFMIQEVLTEDQLALIDRVRMARERHRFRSDMTMGMVGHIQDLSQLLVDLNLPPDQRQLVDPSMAEYEARLTQFFRHQSEQSKRWLLEMFELMEEIGFTEEAMQDPEQAQELMEEMQAVSMRMMERMAEGAQESRRLNERSYRTIAPLLSTRYRMLFRDRFVEGTFPEVSFTTYSMASSRYEVAMTMEAFDDNLRAAIQQAQEAFEQQREQLIDQAIRFAASNHRSPWASMFGQDADEEYTQQISAFQTQSQRLETEANETLANLLPKEENEKVTNEATDARRRQMEERSQTRRVVQTVQSEDTAGYTPRDRLLPTPINSRDLRLFGDVLDFDESQRVLLDELHTEYVAHFEESIAEPVGKLTEAQTNWWRVDEETGRQVTPTEETVEAMFRYRAQALDAIVAADHAFFDDVALVLLDDPNDERLNTVRDMRARARYSRPLRHVDSNVKPYIDVRDLVRLAGVSMESHASVYGIISQWERETLDKLAKHYDIRMRYEQSTQLFSVEMARMSQEERSNWAEIRERRVSIMADVQQAMRASSDALAAGVQSAVDAIRDLLPAHEAVSFIDAFNRRSHPDIFSDSGALHSQLEQALRLPDLTEAQRSSLAELNVEYNARYRAVLNQMVEHRNRYGHASYETLGEDEWQDHMQQESIFTRLEFDRNELNASFVRELEGLLNEEQRYQLGPLPIAQPRNSPW